MGAYLLIYLYFNHVKIGLMVGKSKADYRARV